jgi:hypothetical protein
MTDGSPFTTPTIQAQPDATTSFAEAFRVGQGLAQAGVAPPANAPLRLGPAGANPAATDVSNLANQIDATPPAQRTAVIAHAQQTNEQLAHVLVGLKGYPPAQRLAIAQHMAQTTGLIDPGGLGPGDVSDQGINAHLAQAMAVEQFLKRESLYASIPLTGSTADPNAASGVPSIEARPDPRFIPTGAGHLTSAQLSTALGL